MERQRKVDFRGELVERSEKLRGERQVMQEVAKKMAGKGVKGRGRSRLGGTGLLPLSGPAVPRAATGGSFGARLCALAFCPRHAAADSPELGKAKF